MVELRPVHFTTLHGTVQRVQPAPAFQHYGVAVVVGWVIDLEETLGATFVVNYRTIAFGEASGGKHQMGVFHNSRALMVNDQYQRRFRQRGVHTRC